MKILQSDNICSLIVVLVVLAMGSLFLSSSGGRANDAGAGSTGAPCDNNNVCGNPLCHSNNSFGMTTQAFFLTDPMTGQTVNDYIPGKIYNAQVQVISGAGTGRFGFQLTALDTNYTSIGTWSNLGTNVQVSTALDCNLNTRTYVEHSAPHFFNRFGMDWQAPPCNIGPITFYFAGNKVNFNGAVTGDSGGLGDSATYSVASVDHLVLDQSPISAGSYWANSSIRAEAMIQSSDTIHFRTVDSIVLENPFEIQTGAYFTSQMEDCPND